MAAIESQLNVKIRRDVEIATHPFMEYFKGFENVGAVREVFGEDTEKVLGNLKVEFAGTRGYMGVNNRDGHILISSNYLKEGDIVEIYLDIIHELVHVRQFMEGKELFDDRFDYCERPTEIEAYRYAVEEARKLGWRDENICRYLKTEWMSDEDLKSLAKALEVDCSSFKSEDKTS